jgi:hypothetical protein
MAAAAAEEVAATQARLAAECLSWVDGVEKPLAVSSQYCLRENRHQPEARCGPRHRLSFGIDFSNVRSTRATQRITLDEHPKLIVHGHSPTSGSPQIRPNRVTLDTGAVFGHPLTAGVFTDEKCGPIDFIYG